MCRLLCEHKFSIYLDKYQGMIAGSLGENMFSFVRNGKWSSKKLYHSLSFNFCHIEILNFDLVKLSLIWFVTSAFYFFLTFAFKKYTKS